MPFTEEQNQAITATGNVLVSAGAGSGKTTVLSERVLRKVISGTPIESLLYGRWITFWDMRKRSINIASMYPNIILTDTTPSVFPKVYMYSHLFGRGECL